MISDEFATAEWVERLTRALVSLREVQARYGDYLDEDWWQYRSGDPASGIVAMAHDRSFALLALYHTACFGQGIGEDRRWSPLRTAVNRVQGILADHPAWADVVDISDGRWSGFTIRTAARSGSGSLLHVAGGLMVRAMEVGEDGCRVAAADLSALLETGRERQAAPAHGDLNVGFHVALFYGLRVGENIGVGDDMTIVPFEQLADFVDDNALQDISPAIPRYNRTKFVGAVVKPFRWNLEFNRKHPDGDPDLDWGGSFFGDAEAFIELLAIFHASPAICLATLSYCIHRTANCLLGRTHHDGGYTHGRSARSLGRLPRPNEVSLEAVDNARKAFSGRKGARYEEYAPVVSRLAEALARSGQFAVEDKILDVAIALELMFEVDRGGGAFQLKTRAAYFLENGIDARWKVFEEVGMLFDARSGIIHRRTRQASSEARKEAFTRGFEQAGRSLAKLLNTGPPDWNDLIVVETQCGVRKSDIGSGTTTPAYRNRNDQVVIKRADLPGTNHNQRIYVLRCRQCRHEYGANGSDIWQRKCPKCGGGKPGLLYS